MYMCCGCPSGYRLTTRTSPASDSRAPSCSSSSAICIAPPFLRVRALPTCTATRLYRSCCASSTYMHRVQKRCRRRRRPGKGRWVRGNRGRGTSCLGGTGESRPGIWPHPEGVRDGACLTMRGLARAGRPAHDVLRVRSSQTASDASRGVHGQAMGRKSPGASPTHMPPFSRC